jgi:3-hydroxybutyryl-CoA dehydrogenase
MAVEKGLRHPMGPCKLMDFSGLDTCYLIRLQRYAESQSEIDKPPYIMKEMYERGELGRKVGKGFYEYK